MIVYITTFDYGEIKKGTVLTFNKSNQYFENSNHNIKITNEESFRHPYLIKVLKEVTNRSENKKVINIPF